MLDRYFNASPTRTEPSQFKVGTGDTEAQLTDTDLENAVPITGTESVDDCEATTGWTDSADMTVSLNTSTYKEAAGSLNLTKDGTGSATASTSKTTTSRDFTSKELSAWVYIADATQLAKLATSACVEIRFGSDSSNYYSWTKDASFFATGWNLVDNLTSANATTTGSPAIAACDYTYIGVTATGAGISWVAGKMAMDDIKVISTGDYFKTFEAGYPSVDYVNLQGTVRGRLATTDANGYDIAEVGIFNADGSPLMESRDVWSGASKTDDDEFIFVIKTQLE